MSSLGVVHLFCPWRRHSGSTIERPTKSESQALKPSSEPTSRVRLQHFSFSHLGSEIEICLGNPADDRPTACAHGPKRERTRPGIALMTKTIRLRDGNRTHGVLTAWIAAACSGTIADLTFPPPPGLRRRRGRVDAQKEENQAEDTVGEMAAQPTLTPSHQDLQAL